MPGATAGASLFIFQAGNIVAASLVLASLLSAVHVAIAVGLNRWSATVRALDGAARSDLIIQIMWLLTCTPIPVLYGMSMPELRGRGAEGRWLGTSTACEWAMLLHVASSLYEAGVYCVYRKPWLYYVHHAIVLYAYGVGLWVGAMHFWGAWDGLTEASNVNLCILKIGLILQRGRGSRGETLNGILLYFSFLVVRVASLPLWLGLYAAIWFFVRSAKLIPELLQGSTDAIWACKPNTITAAC